MKAREHNRKQEKRERRQLSQCETSVGPVRDQFKTGQSAVWVEPDATFRLLSVQSESGS